MNLFTARRFVPLRKLLSFFLIFALIFTLIPTNATEAAKGAETAKPKKQELLDQRTATTKLFDNGDGTFSKQIFPLPVHRKNGDQWEEISAKLIDKVNTDVVVPENTELGVQFLKTMKKGEYATVEDGPHALNYSIIGAKDDVPAVYADNRITYENVFPGVHLRNIIFNTSVKEDIVLTEYQGMNRFSFHIKTALDAQLDESGAVNFLNKDGEAIFTLPKPFMTDSNIDEKSGEAQRSEEVSYALAKQNNGWQLTVTADAKWLQDPARQYPVFIDPTTMKTTQGNDTYVTSQWPTTNYNGDWDSTYGFYGLKTGYYPGAGENYSYVKMIIPTTPDLRGYNIDSATFGVYTGHSYSTSNTGVWLDTVSTNWSPSTMTWNNKPSSTALTSTQTAKGQWATFNVTTAVRNWVNGGLSNNFGFKLHTNGNGETYWKKFYSAENASNYPYLNIVYSTKTPSAPTYTAYANWTGSESGFIDLKWSPVPNATGYKVWIFNGAQYEAIDVKNVTSWSTQNKRIWPTPAEVEQGRYRLHLDGLGAELAKDPSAVYTNAGGSPEWGYSYTTSTRYYIRVSAYGAHGESPMSAGISTPIPERSEDLGTETFWQFASVPGGVVNAATGNLVHEAGDAAISGRGPDVAISREYNSRSNADGAFGYGWTYTYGMSLREDSAGNVLLYDVDGTTHQFKKNADGSYLRPLGVYLDLSKNSGFTLTNRDKVKHIFDAAGKLIKVQDDNNNALTLTYDAAGLLTTIRDASGRLTKFAYDTVSGNIATITDPNNRVWRYAYTGKLLTAVTDPSGVVVEYIYDEQDKLIQKLVKQPSNTADVVSGVSYTYDAEGRLASVKDALNETTTLTYDTAGSKLSVTDAKGVVDQFAYNAMGNPTGITKDVNGLKLMTAYVYDHNNMTERKDPNTKQLEASGTVQAPTEKYVYDSNGNITQATDVKGSRTYKYNANNDVISFTDVKGNEYKNTYDGKNLTSSTDPAKVTDGKVYDPSGNGNVIASTQKMGMAENLLVNSGMEHLHFDLTKDFVKLAGNDNGTIGFETKPALTGSAIKVVSVPVNTQWGYNAATKDVAVKPNTTYLLKGKVKTSNVLGGGAFLNTYQMDASGAAITASYLDNRASRVSGTTDWTDQELRVTTSATTYKLRVFLELEHSGVTSSGTAWFDTMQLIDLTNGSEPANWSKATLNDTGMVTSDASDPRQGYQAVKLSPKSTSSNFGYVAVTQDIAVKPNTTYTLSGLVKTENLTGAAAFFNTLQLRADGSATAAPYADNRYSELNGTTDWTERQLSFTTASDATKVRVFLEVDHNTAATSGAAWFDNIQLEPNAVSTKYNPLENSSFENGITVWQNWSGGQTDSTVAFDGNKSLKFSRATTADAHGAVIQRVYLNQTEAQPVTISGMSKAQGVNNAVETGKSADYSIWVDAGHGDSSYTVGQAMFSLGTHDWQRAAVTINPTRPIKYLNLYTLFRNNNTGTVWFDNIRVQEGKTITTYEYDALGNYVTKQTNANNESNLTSYDAAGNLLSKTDAKGNVRTFTYDGLDRMTSAKFDSGNIKVNLAYDKFGNVAEQKLTSADGAQTFNTTTYRYNAAGLLSEAVDPLGDAVRYNYDQNGRLIQVQNPNGTTNEYTMDATGRAVEAKYNGQVRYKFTYDANGNGTKTEDVALGLTKTRAYDKANRLTATTTENGTVSYKYDGNDNLEQRNITNNGTAYHFNYSFNNINQNTLLKDVSADKTYRFDYDEAGNMRSFINGNGVGTMMGYDDNNQLKQLSIGTADGKMLGEFAYRYDELGNRTEVRDAGGNLLTAYTYDSMNRLTSEIDRVTGNKLQYAYSPTGNRTQKLVQDSAGNTLSATNYTYNAMNQLTSVGGQAMVYDKNGQLLDDGKKLYTWDAAGRLVQVQDKASGSVTAEYFYDEDGRRIRKVVNGQVTNFVYNGHQVVYETNANNVMTRYYTYSASGGLLSTTKVGGETYFYHSNEHGDIIAVTDANGVNVAEYTYDAYGNIIAQSGSFAEENAYRYAGYRYDTETNLYYLIARYYNAAHGSFLSLDPEAGLTNEPMTLNGYAYANHNPVMFIDPDGHFLQFAVALLAIPIVAVVATIAYWTLFAAVVTWTISNDIQAPSRPWADTTPKSDTQTASSKSAPGTKSQSKSGKKVVDVSKRGNWVEVPKRKEFLEQNGYTEEAAKQSKLKDMDVNVVKDKDGVPVGEIHNEQPEYEYENGKMQLDKPTGRYFPDHFHPYTPGTTRVDKGQPHFNFKD